MTYLLSIDPGMSTGIVSGWYSDTDPYVREEFWQVEGGLAGFRQWWWGWPNYYTGDPLLVCEKFTPLPSMTRSFKLNELEPIRIEGALEVLWDRTPIVWQRPAAMVLAGGDTTARRKKNSDDVLRRMGLWTTGKQVGCKDANDVNSAQKHAVAYLRSIGHAPTLQALLEES